MYEREELTEQLTLVATPAVSPAVEQENLAMAPDHVPGVQLRAVAPCLMNASALPTFAAL